MSDPCEVEAKVNHELAQASSLNRDERERRLLIGKLLKDGVIYERHDPGLWNSVNRRRDMVQADLNRIGVFLKIVDSGKSHYACVTNFLPNDENYPRIVSKKKFGRHESFIAAFLRMAYADYERNAEERCVVPCSRIIDEFLACKKINDEQALKKNILKILQKFKKLGIVNPVGTDEKEFEVLAMIKEVVTVSDLDKYKDSLRKYFAEHAEIQEESEEED